MPKQAIGIDIGSHSVKVAVLQRKGGATRAVRLYRRVLAGDTDLARVQGAIANSGIRGGPALVGITGRDLIVKYTHVPPVPDWRLQLLMQFEINEVSSQSGGDVAADYRRLQLPGDRSEETVLVVLARNSWFQPRLQTVKGAGISATGGCPNSVALFNAYLAHGKAEEGKTVYLVSIGRDSLDMAIARDGELLFARNIAGGGQLFTQAIMQAFELKEPKAEANKLQKGDLTPRGVARYPDSTTEKLANAMQGPAGQLVSMIQSSVMVCRAQTKTNDLNIDKLVLTGGGAKLKGIREYFEANMSIPVEIFDPVASLDTSALAPEDASELGEEPLDFAVAVGLAESQLAPNAFRLEVLSEKAKKARRFAQRTVWSLLAAAAALVLVVLLFRNRAADIETVRASNVELDQLLGRNRKQQERGDRALRDALDGRKKDVALRARRLGGALLRTVADLVIERHPEHIFLRDFQMRCDKVSLDIEGRPSVAGAADADRIPDQVIWPVVEVTGEVQTEYTPNAGQTLNAYFTELRSGGLPVVEGWRVEMETTSLNAKNQFQMTFTLKPKEETQGS
jgi:type IV pilus assembly protein PilM